MIVSPADRNGTETGDGRLCLWAGGTGGTEGTAKRASVYLIAGDLALDGRVRPIKGALSMAMLPRHKGLGGVSLPRPNAPEAAVCEALNRHRISGSLRRKFSLISVDERTTLSRPQRERPGEPQIAPSDCLRV